LSVIHFECRTVLRPRLAVIVDACGGDVGGAEPFLHLGDVGLMVKGIGGGRRAQRMGADLEATLWGTIRPSVHRPGRRIVCERNHGTRDPAQVPAAFSSRQRPASSSAHAAFLKRSLAVALEHQVSGAPDIDLGYHAEKTAI
jgi:hypothetical protein